MRISTTRRYMHLSPAATQDAIRLLDGRETGTESVEKFGDIILDTVLENTTIQLISPSGIESEAASSRR